MNNNEINYVSESMMSGLNKLKNDRNIDTIWSLMSALGNSRIYENDLKEINYWIYSFESILDGSKSVQREQAVIDFVFHDSKNFKCKK